MESSQDLVRHGKRWTRVELVGEIVQGLVNEQGSGPEDQRNRGSEDQKGLGLGQGLGLGPQLQEWGEAQGWNRVRMFSVNIIFGNPKQYFYTLQECLC